MTQTQFPEIVVRDYGTLVDALRAAKDHRQISFELIDALAGARACPERVISVEEVS